jgi:hypothetical protein
LCEYAPLANNVTQTKDAHKTPCPSIQTHISMILKHCYRQLTTSGTERQESKRQKNLYK